MSRHERTALRARGSVHTGRVQPPPAKEPTAVEYLQVKIPLRPQEKPVAFPQNFAEMLQEEYAIKYLQRLGALPTQENVAMVLKHLPLDECQITSAWKARGSLADVVMVDLYTKPHTGIRLTPECEDSEFSADVASAKSTRKQRMYAATSALNEPIADTLTTSKSYQVGSVCMSFDDMKHQYLLPFKHGMRHEADVLTMFAMKHEEPVTFVHIPALAEIHTKPTLQLFGRRATQRRIKCIEERVRPPEIRAEFTTQMLRAFITALPFGALGVRSDAEQHTLSELLLHDELATLIEATVRYLYLEVFFKLGCLGAVDLIKSATIQAYHRNAPTEIEALYVTIVRIFDTIKLRMEREEKGMTLYLPLHLLALRVAVETVFRCQYPVSFNVTAPTMQYILTEMNDQITKVLDGDLLLSRIGILETTCESSKIMASHAYQVKKRRARLRDQYFQTSEAIHTIFPNPISGKCRKMIKFRGGAAIGNYPLAVVEPTERDSVDASARGDATSDNNQSTPFSHGASAFAESTRTAALPGASLETRLELLHLMERSRVQALKEPKRPVVLLPPPQRQAKTAR